MSDERPTVARVRRTVRTRWWLAVASLANRRTAVGLYFLALGLVAFLPTLGGGFVLQLDMVFAPDASYVGFLLAEKGPLYYGRLPFVAILDVVTVVVPGWIVQRALLVGAVAGAGGAAYAVTDDLRFPARLFAGTLYAVNPFTYVRLLAGQWYLVLGYAALPLALVAFYEFVAGERDRPYRAVGWAAVVAVFDPHAAVLLAVAGAVVLALTPVHEGEGTLYRGLGYSLVGVVVNAFWLLPAAVALASGDSQLSTVGVADLLAFAPDGVVAGNVPLSVTMLYGFWRPGYTYPFDIAPLALVVIVFAALLFVAVLGVLARRDGLGDGLALVAVLAAVLAVGMGTDLTAPIARSFVATPVGTGMRDTGKFVGVLALAYAILGARGVDSLLDSLHDARPGRPSSLSDVEIGVGGSVRDTAPRVLAVLVILLPLVYTFPMVAGFWGGFTTTEYPADWHAVDERIEHEGDQYRTLVLPWHQYQRFEWTGTKVANPAPLFFGPTVVSSRNPDIGVGSQATDPTHRRVQELLDRDDEKQFGAEMAPLGVKYVLLLKGADSRQYAFLGNQTDLTVVTETDGIVLYRNEAFEAAPPPSEWPRDGPRVPWLALVIGMLVSVTAVAVVTFSGRPGNGSWRGGIG